MAGSLITGRPPGLVDVLDRILDKGLVIAGDIKVSLANVELLTLQIRLLVCSIDKAEQIGLNWWRYDRNLAPSSAEDPKLSQRVAELEKTVERLSLPAAVPRVEAGKRVQKSSSRKRAVQNRREEHGG